MNKWLFFLMIIISTVSAIFIILKINTTPVFNYYPIDPQATFVQANTELHLSNKKNSPNELVWEIHSKSNQSLYLRQDISLLYENGKFKGVQSKWSEKTSSIQIKEKNQLKSTGLFESISFHHGEIHGKTNEIRSVQTMSHDSIYVNSITGNKNSSFKSPKKSDPSIWKDQLDNDSKQTLFNFWDQLIAHYDLKSESYFTVPLAELYKYNNQSLPSMTKDQTDKIIGQLWEGLYKNYVIQLFNTKKRSSHFMPLILFDKENTHLLVLFELNGKKSKLIQQYSL